MILYINSLLSWLSSLAGNFFTDQGLKFVAYKALIFTGITVTFPAVVKNLLNWLFEGLISIAGNAPGMDGMQSATYQFTGITAYLASNLMLPECIAIIITACIIRLALNFVPFIG